MLIEANVFAGVRMTRSAGSVAIVAVIDGLTVDAH